MQRRRVLTCFSVFAGLTTPGLSALAGGATLTLLDKPFARDVVIVDGRTLVLTDEGNYDYPTCIYEDGVGYEPIGDGVGKQFSSDGSVVVGTIPEASTFHQAGRWTRTPLGWQGLGGLPGGSCGSLSDAYDVSGDGSTVVGLGWGGCSGLAFKWTAGGGMVALENLGNGNNRATVISTNGQRVAGFAQGTFNRTPAYWAPDGTGQLIDIDVEGEFSAINADGTILAGQYYDATVSAFLEPFRWTVTGGVEIIGSLPTHPGGFIHDMSDDGNTLVGYSGTPLGGTVAMIWRPQWGPTNLRDKLIELGVSNMGTFIPAVVTAVTPDGNTLVGWGFVSEAGTAPSVPVTGYQGFLVTLDDETGAECAPVPGTCCAGLPRYEDPAYTFTGKIAVGTGSPAVGQVVTVYDFSDLDSAPLDSDWPVGRYSHPSWSGNNLGSVFGVTMDPDGNIYVTATTCYDSNNDIVGSGGSGGVYRIDGVTGNVSVFASLPNTGPGLGNITYDCANDQLFVTNHEDGKIYRLNTAGTILSAYDHGTPDDGTDGFAPLGDRLWGVAAHDGRLWYSVWHEDFGRQSSTATNEVWSVELDGTGDFAGGAQLEISMPPWGVQDYSNPVSDLRFTPTGTLLAAEHGMDADGNPTPHQSRVLEYECAGGAWVPSPHTFDIGVGLGGNSSGGIDIDYDVDGRVWASGDAIHYRELPVYTDPDFIYGFQGLPATGGSPDNSVLVDYQGIVGFIDDKTDIGDIVVSCPATMPEPSCVEVATGEVQCVVDPETGPTGDYDVTLTVTNNSGIDARYILLPDAITEPDFIALPAALPGDGSSMTIRVTLTGATPLTEACFMMVLADENVDECCAGEEICVTVPACDCLQATNAQLACDPLTGVVTLEFDVTNLTADDVEHVYVLPPLAPAIGSEIEIPDSYFDIPTLLPYQTAHIGPVLLENATADLDIDLRVTMHVQSFAECCSEIIPVTLPSCASAATLPDNDPCVGDIDGDGQVGFGDMTALLAAWDSAAVDLNGDGVASFGDLTKLLSFWGPCVN